MKENEVSLEDLRKAAKLIKENTPCTCKVTNSIYCPKHNLLKIFKGQQKAIKDMFF